MTNEEAKHIVDVAFGVPQAVRRAGEDRTYHEDEIREAKQMAIKALEQEPVLDKISTEIEQYEADCMFADTSKECKECDRVMFGTIYRIIDKHKKKSEVQS